MTLCQAGDALGNLFVGAPDGGLCGACAPVFALCKIPAPGFFTFTSGGLLGVWLSSRCGNVIFLFLFAGTSLAMRPSPAHARKENTDATDGELGLCKDPTVGA